MNPTDDSKRTFFEVVASNIINMLYDVGGVCFMKEFKNIMIFALVSAIAACPIHIYASGDNDAPVATAIETNQLKISGVVTYNSLETGFYEVDGYRLEGEYDFSKYEGKSVVVKGEISNSMSIFMNKAIKVSTIEELKIPELPVVKEKMVLEGQIVFNTLEGGFYELQGYRLVGDTDFAEYAGKTVVVTGVEDTGSSIYMTKAIRVDSIKASAEDVENGITEKTIDEIINKMEEARSAMLDSIKKDGVDSVEGIKYKEEIKILKDSALKSLEELVKIDGRNADISKFEKLGKVLSISEEKAISVYINGIRTDFEQGALPFIDSGRTLVPFRAVAEGLGADVSWDGKAQKVTVKKGERVIELTIGSNAVYVDGKTLELDVPAKIVNGRTVIPLRFIGQSLDTTVEWIPEGQIIVISSNADHSRPAIDSTDFTVKYNNGSIKLGDWDDKINIEEIFGEPLSEETEQLGPNADTFNGTYVKELKYDGLVLSMNSPKDNGKTFYVRMINIAKDDFVTARGVKVGDSYRRILEEYMYTPLWETNYDPKNHEYLLKDEGYNYIKFEVKEGVVKSISIYMELP